MSNLNYKKTNLFYSVSGSGEPILLLHGFLESSVMWNDYTTELNTTNTVIRVDLLGHGKTGNLDTPHSMDAMAASVIYVLKHLKIETCKVVGHSMGGYVALAMADARPEMVKSILLFFSSAAADTPEKKINRDRVKKLVVKSKNTFVRVTVSMLFTYTTREKYAVAFEQLITEAQAMTTGNICAAVDGLKNRPDRTHLLNQNQIPVSFVSGKNDEAIPLESLKEQHQAKAVAKITLTENGHMGHIEDRDLCLNAIREFIA